MGIQGLFSLCRGAPLLFLFGAIWLILQQKSMSLERAISQGFLFTFIERKTLQYQAFLSIKLVFYLRKQSSKLAKFGGLREGETNKKVTPNTNNDLAPAHRVFWEIHFWEKWIWEKILKNSVKSRGHFSQISNLGSTKGCLKG